MARHPSFKGNSEAHSSEQIDLVQAIYAYSLLNAAFRTKFIPSRGYLISRGTTRSVISALTVHDDLVDAAPCAGGLRGQLGGGRTQPVRVVQVGGAAGLRVPRVQL